MKENGTNRLPKFDSTPWLVLGAAGSMGLFVISLWSAIAARGEAFFPFLFGKIFSMVVGIVIAIHCIDMIGYWKTVKKELGKGNEGERQTS